MNDWEFIAPMVVAIVLIVTTGGVAILRPLSKRVAELIEVTIKEKQRGEAAAPGDLARLRQVMESIDARLSLLEERQDFTDSLLDGTSRTSLPAGRGVGERV